MIVIKEKNVFYIYTYIFRTGLNFQFLHPLGAELLYRDRDGDVVKYNVDTEERTVLVTNKKFVSIFTSTRQDRDVDERLQRDKLEDVFRGSAHHMTCSECGVEWRCV